MVVETVAEEVEAIAIAPVTPVDAAADPAVDIAPMAFEAPAPDAPAEPAADAEPAAPAAEPAATPEPPSAALPSDPMAELEAELDRLIPLGGRKIAEPVPPPVMAEAAPPPAPEPEPVAPPQPDLDDIEATIAAELGRAKPSVKAETPAPEPLIEIAPDAQAASVPPDVLVAPGETIDEPQTAPPPDAEIVGSYESGGARYTMYSNGGVIVEAEGRALHFASLDALREFIESSPKP